MNCQPPRPSPGLDERRPHRCLDCGRTREEANQLDVHHLAGREEGDHPDNLVTLCRRCHLQGRHERDAEWLRSPFDPPQATGVNPPMPSGLTPSDTVAP